MRQQVPNGDTASIRGGRTNHKPGDISSHRLIQVHQFTFDELHDSQRREALRKRSQDERGMPIDSPASSGSTKPGSINYLSMLNYRYRETRQAQIALNLR